MTNILRFTGTLFIECLAAIFSGKDVRSLYKRIIDIFYIKPKNHQDLTELENDYVFLFILMMASGKEQFSLGEIQKHIGQDDDTFQSIVSDCADHELISSESNQKSWADTTYSIDGALEHFSHIRNIYVHDGDTRPDVASGIYKLLEKVHYITRCNPAMTFISLKGDVEFREEILQRRKRSYQERHFPTVMTREVA